MNSTHQRLPFQLISSFLDRIISLIYWFRNLSLSDRVAHATFCNCVIFSDATRPMATLIQSHVIQAHAICLLNFTKLVFFVNRETSFPSDLLHLLNKYILLLLTFLWLYSVPHNASILKIQLFWGFGPRGRNARSQDDSRLPACINGINFSASGKHYARETGASPLQCLGSFKFLHARTHMVWIRAHPFADQSRAVFIYSRWRAKSCGSPHPGSPSTVRWEVVIAVLIVA